MSGRTGLLVACLCIFAIACKKPDANGENVLPGNLDLTLGYTEIPVTQTRTDVEDSLMTNGSSYGLLGNYVDPFFGRVNAETYLQFRLDGTNLVFGDSLIYDSLVLSLAVNNVYGRPEDKLSVHVFELSDHFTKSDTLYSDTTLGVKGSDLTLTPEFSLSTGVTTGDIRLRLDPALGNRLLFAPTDSLADDNAFTQYLKGLHISTDPVTSSTSREPGGIYQLNYNSTATSLTLYFRSIVDGDTIVQSHAFRLKDESLRFHHLDRSEYSATAFNTAMDGSGGLNSDYMFLQGGSFAKLGFTVDSLSQFSGKSINKAELVLRLDPSSLTSPNTLRAPNLWVLFAADSTGLTPESALAVTTGYQETDYTVRFSVTNYISQVVSGQRNHYGFLVTSGVYGIDIFRAVIGGAGNATLAPTLRVYSTTIQP